MNEPAFPQRSVDSDGNLYERGMTLRDYFAAKAVQGELAATATSSSRPIPAEVAWFAYEVADAMLKARSATNTEGTK